MESIGEKLRASREEKGLSVDQVARDTNIAKRYINALEDEAFSDFPGEPYLIGFLRNYSDYLGLDAEEIVGLYKNFKIQEQPVPMEELLDRQHSRRSPLLFIVIIVVVLLVVAGVLFIPQHLSKRSGVTAPPTAKTAKSQGTQYELTDEIVEKRFVAGDTVVVPVGDKSYKVKLSVSGRDLVLTDAAGQQTVKLGQEKSIDLNGDGTPDLKVFLRNIDAQDPAHGIVVRFDRFAQSPNAQSGSQPAAQPGTVSKPAPRPPAAPSTRQTGPSVATVAPSRPVAAAPRAAAPVAAAPAVAPAPQATASQTPAPRAPAPRPQTAAQQTTQPQASAPQAPAPQTQFEPQALPRTASSLVPTTPVPAAVQTIPTITPESSGTVTGPVVIMQNGAATPFTVNVDFSGYCLFRYLIDGQTEDQRYFQKGETTRLDVKQDVEIWASNGGVLNMTIAGNSVDMGNPGQVVARRIEWVRNQDTGRYQLRMSRVQ